MPEKKIFLIDGNSLLYRSYYAIQRLSTSKGFPTNAIYGFLSILRRLQDQENPGFLGVVFDAKGPTIRHEQYEEYKATRKPMPEDLVEQIPVLKKILKAMNIPIYELENYEADDVLVSLAQKAKKHNLKTVIVSNDKDLLQSVDSSTAVFNPVKNIYFDEEKVKELFGVLPSQVIDVLSLWGDSSDNIPGVPGIGEKTSKALIEDFGSLEELMNNMDKIPNASLRDKIEKNLDQLKLSRELVTIKKDLEVDLELDQLRIGEPDLEKLIPVLEEMEFTSLVTNYRKNKETTKKVYETVLNTTALKTVIDRIKKKGEVSVDTETDSPYPTQAKLVGISLSVEPHSAWYIPLGHDYLSAPQQILKQEALSLLEPALSDPKIKKTGQNIKYDYIVLKREGLELQGLDMDTMVLSYLLEPNWGKHNLNKLAAVYLQTKTISYDEITGKGKNAVTMDKVDIDKVTPYACQDADFAFRLASILLPKIKEEGLEELYRSLELPLIEVLANMEMWGVNLDISALQRLSEELQENLQSLEKKIYNISGEKFNLNSPQQMAYILFEKIGLNSSRKTKKTRSLSTNVAVLQELAGKHKIVEYVLEYRKLSKLKSTYADALPLLINPETKRIHTSYNQTVTATGRLSSSDPNLQNIPVKEEWGKRFRQAFIPSPGCLFLSADYSQIELRVLAHLSEDPALIESFKKDRDIHQETANRVFGEASGLFPEEQRRRAKIINFSMIYGASAFSLARELCTSREEAQEFIDTYYAKYPKVHEYLEKIVSDAEKKGFSETLFGRKRPVPELKQSNKAVQQAGRRIALNTPIQGTAADLIKKAMIDIWREFKKKKLNTKMILQVHDELVFDVPDEEQKIAEKIVVEKMEKAVSLKVPVKVHVGWGINWAEAK